MRSLYDKEGAVEVEINGKKVSWIDVEINGKKIMWTDSDDVYIDTPEELVHLGNLKWQDEHIYIHNIMLLKHFVEKETT
jgi:hypothetical protein